MCVSRKDRVSTTQVDVKLSDPLPTIFTSVRKERIPDEFWENETNRLLFVEKGGWLLSLDGFVTMWRTESRTKDKVWKRCLLPTLLHKTNSLHEGVLRKERWKLSHLRSIYHNELFTLIITVCPQLLLPMSVIRSHLYSLTVLYSSRYTVKLTSSLWAFWEIIPDWP